MHALIYRYLTIKITKAYILGPILYKILCTVLNYGFGYKYVYMLVLQL